ncbi:MAG: DUF1893 domain-containing protein [bacterium]
MDQTVAGDLILAARYIKEGKCSLVMIKEGIVTATKTGRGIRPLLELWEEQGSFKKFTLGDKVIGKAAALLAINGEAAGVYAHLISEPALSILSQYQVQVKYEQITKMIINRKGTDSCPMEKLAITIDRPEEAPAKIKQRLLELNQGQLF